MVATLSILELRHLEARHTRTLRDRTAASGCECKAELKEQILLGRGASQPIQQRSTRPVSSQCSTCLHKDLD